MEDDGNIKLKKRSLPDTLKELEKIRQNGIEKHEGWLKMVDTVIDITKEEIAKGKGD